MLAKILDDANQKNQSSLTVSEEMMDEITDERRRAFGWQNVKLWVEEVSRKYGFSYRVDPESHDFVFQKTSPSHKLFRG